MDKTSIFLVLLFSFVNNIISFILMLVLFFFLRKLLHHYQLQYLRSYLLDIFSKMAKSDKEIIEFSFNLNKIS